MVLAHRFIGSSGTNNEKPGVAWVAISGLLSVHERLVEKGIILILPAGFTGALRNRSVKVKHLVIAIRFEE